jgi:hypothetical protein
MLHSDHATGIQVGETVDLIHPIVHPSMRKGSQFTEPTFATLSCTFATLECREGDHVWFGTLTALGHACRSIISTEYLQRALPHQHRFAE